MRRVILESPYSGDVPRNEAYGRAAMADCLARGEAPFPSHLLYTQPGVLDDKDAAQRALGTTAGRAWYTAADYVVVYTDWGISPGMEEGIAFAKSVGLEVFHRQQLVFLWKDERRPRRDQSALPGSTPTRPFCPACRIVHIGLTCEQAAQLLTAWDPDITDASRRAEEQASGAASVARQLLMAGEISPNDERRRQAELSGTAPGILGPHVRKLRRALSSLLHR